MTASTGPSTAKYPHDRVVFFSDAVFAIAITLLAIEVKVPTDAAIEAYGLAGAMWHLAPLLIGFAVTFLVTALFWKSHLELGQLIQDFDDRLVWLNVFMLMGIALLPFTTVLYSEHVGLDAAFTIYCLHLTAIGVVNYFMHAYAIRKEHLVERIGALRVQALRARILTAPIVFLACIPLAYASPLAGRCGFALLFVAKALLNRHYRRRAAREAAAASVAATAVPAAASPAPAVPARAPAGTAATPPPAPDAPTNV